MLLTVLVGVQGQGWMNGSSGEMGPWLMPDLATSKANPDCSPSWTGLSLYFI